MFSFHVKMGEVQLFWCIRFFFLRPHAEVLFNTKFQTVLNANLFFRYTVTIRITSTADSRYSAASSQISVVVVEQEETFI